ncbi:MAG: hypothetical protein QXW52_09565 [Candidatus Caldarchaeum sp.]
MRVSHSKAVSTALATIAIILVLILGMSWMAYMTVLNAAQQARHAGAAETAALKAKELVRVYIWLDPANQPGGGYRNLTRISFVNTWSGETTINSLLIVWRDGRYEERPVSIRLGAGEDKTYLPSQLGLEGLDNYQAALERIKYIQVHTSLGNDFVSLWGRPDKPALYVTGTTRTDTYTVTRTSTTVTGTTTTRTTTTTSYTTTWTTTTTGPPPPGTPILLITGGVGCDGGYVSFSFDPNGWGTPPYIIRGEWGMTNEWGFPVGSGVIGPYIVYGPFSWGAEVYPQGDAAGYGITFRVVDSEGRLAEKGAGWGFNCQPPPPPPGGGGTTTPPGPTTGTTTQPPAATTYTITQTVTSTSFVFPEATTTITVNVQATTIVTVTSTWWSTVQVNTYITHIHYPPCVEWRTVILENPNPAGCQAPQTLGQLDNIETATRPETRQFVYNQTPTMSISLIVVLSAVQMTGFKKSRRNIILPTAIILLIIIISHPMLMQTATSQYAYTTTTVTEWTTITWTNVATATATVTQWVTYTQETWVQSYTTTTVTITTTSWWYWTCTGTTIVMVETQCNCGFGFCQFNCFG